MPNDDLQDAVNYLGHSTSVNFKGGSDIPSTESPTGLPSIPAGSSGTSKFSPFGKNVGKAGSQFDVGRLLASLGFSGVSKLRDAGVKSLLQPGQGGPGPEVGIEQSAPLGQVSGGELGVGAPELANAFTEAAPLGEVSGGELGVGVETGLGAAGEGLGGALTGAGGVIGAYSLGTSLNKMLTGEGPSSGNPYVDMVLGLIPVLGPDVLAPLIGEFLGPSNAWKNFGQGLGETLGHEQGAIQLLVNSLQRAENRGDISQSVGFFRDLVERGGVGGYQLGNPLSSGAPQIGTLPGAGGTKHEGGLTAEFGPEVNAVNQLLEALYGQLPSGGATPLTEEAFSFGLDQPTYTKFRGLADQLMSQASLDNPPWEVLAGDLPGAMKTQIAQSGLPPEVQAQLTDYVTRQLNMQWAAGLQNWQASMGSASFG